jgi:hypothetical protein
MAPLGMGSAYVLNFSDRTMAEWFEDELRIDPSKDKTADVIIKTEHVSQNRS